MSQTLRGIFVNQSRVVLGINRKTLGIGIKHIKNVHKYIRKEDIPEHTLFVIITDGYENASHKYSSNEVKKMIEKQKKEKNWEFLFIGANIDAIETAKHYGIDRDYAFNYNGDAIGSAIVYNSISEKLTKTRACGKNKKSSNECFDDITNDYENRKV